MQAIFPSFPAFFAQSPCPPANIVPAANAPAATSAMSLVIVEAETASAESAFNFEIVWHVPVAHVSLTTLKIEARKEIFPLNHPFRISRGSRTEACVVTVSMSDGQYTGRGEGVPIARYNQSADSVLEQINSIASITDLDRDKLQHLLPPGAARNAVDCAFWDLQAKHSGKRAWELANIPIARCSRRPMGDAHSSHSEAATTNAGDADQVETSFTISLDTPARMADAAAAALDLPMLKLKLCGDDNDLARVEAVRAAASNARLLIDANESWSPRHYRNTASALKELGVELIEQPFPADADDVLETLDHPVPVCADESCHTSIELARLKNRYEAINIKLDKTGGLTEALQLYQRARENNFQILIGCMVCTSLSIAPARLLASNADWVDLDGPLLLARDRDHPVPVRVRNNGNSSTPIVGLRIAGVCASCSGTVTSSEEPGRMSTPARSRVSGAAGDTRSS